MLIYGIGIINTPGTLMLITRGEIKVALINLGERPYTIHRGDRIAQMVIQKVYQGQYEIVGALEETERNEGGFGHTGVYRLRILE